MEEKFNTIREVLGIFGEDAFYSITITKWEVRMQGYATRESFGIAVDNGFIKEEGITYIKFHRDKTVVIFT